MQIGQGLVGIFKFRLAVLIQCQVKEGVAIRAFIGQALQRFDGLFELAGFDSFEGRGKVIAMNNRQICPCEQEEAETFHLASRLGTELSARQTRLFIEPNISDSSTRDGVILMGRKFGSSGPVEPNWVRS